ncbi:hypothetical protein G4B88_025511 [Cannabis sativa]|uniref:FAD/NAD(P)-binding domain-containing protein n=1 Tax=Cannabis sativa TaxID=3483 RepID=A0A7J6DYH7_CANSA|nr:hypothetical protein G4B88_025511 [Cannabis sativa]
MEGEKRRVVIIGGGVAGSLLAKSIQFNSNLTLIDEKEYFEIPWARWRAMVDPSFGERSVINHRDYLSNGRIVASSAIDITETEDLTAEGRLIPYDYLIIAIGHIDSVPKTRTEMLNQYQKEQNVEEDGRVFPVSNSSSTIIDCLMSEANRTGGAYSLSSVVQTGKIVRMASANGGKFLLGIRKQTTSPLEYLEAEYLLIASGNNSQGFSLASQLGHSIIDSVPSLFTFKTVRIHS